MLTLAGRLSDRKRVKVTIEQAAVDAQTTVEAIVEAISQGLVDAWRFTDGVYVDHNALERLELPVCRWWKRSDFAELWNATEWTTRLRLLPERHIEVSGTFYYPQPDPSAN